MEKLDNETSGAAALRHDAIPESDQTRSDEVEARFAELISTELDHYAQKIAKRVLRKALGGKIAERSSADNT